MVFSVKNFAEVLCRDLPCGGEFCRRGVCWQGVMHVPTQDAQPCIQLDQPHKPWRPAEAADRSQLNRLGLAVANSVHVGGAAGVVGVVVIRDDPLECRLPSNRCHKVRAR